MGILRADRITGLGGANAIKGSVFFPHDGTASTTSGALQIQNKNDALTFGTGDFTIEFWFYTNRIGVTQHLYDGRGTGAGSNAAILIQISDSNNIRFFTTNAFRITGSSTLKANTWYHIALTRTGSTHTLYVDGSSDGTYSASNTYLGPTNGFSAIGSDDNGAGAYGLNGYISNLRIAKELIYSAAFTVPTTELTPTSNTTLLCCQSPGDAQASFGGLTLTSFAASTNSRGPEASRFTPNSPVGFSTTTDVGSQYGTTFDGFGSFATSTYMVPPGGNTRERNRGRGIFADGDQSTDIEFINIQSMGNSQEFGDSTTNFKQRASVSSSTRTVTGGGFNSPNFTNILDFITIANTANATDFGDLTIARRNIGGAGNNTRGILYGGASPSSTNTIEFITLATAGNASDFGDATAVDQGVGSFASPTRAVFGGGLNNTIDFVTIATTGNATDFGDLTTGQTEKPAGASSSTRGLFICGEAQPSATRLNTIQFVTIATTGNATDFGDNTFLLRSMGACTNSLRAVYGGGNDPSATLNTMSYVTIATTGNGQDFGDLLTGRSVHACGSSDSHGGL